MSQIETQLQPAVTDGGMPVRGYRALSGLAIVSLILGVLSVVAVFSPLLGIVPLIAIGVSALAARRIALNSERLSGRWMTIIGLFLATLFLGWGLSYDFARRERFFSHARQFGDDWLQILNRNEPYVAHQLKVGGMHRVDPRSNLEIAYQSDERGMEEYTTFVGESPVKDILAGSPHSSFHFEECLGHKQTGFDDVVTLQYLCDIPKSGKQRVWLTVLRTYSIYSDRADWHIVGISTSRPYTN